MFTDLVDSTALMSRVGESAAETLRREHFVVLRSAIDERGGREVKNLGDGLMVVFSSAADAVATAVDIQRALSRRNRRAVEPLVVRVGIALGDADVDEGDFFGVPVVQAARLCAEAAGGEVLCTDIVRALTGSRVEAGFESVGALDLKGLDEPVATSRATWEDEDTGTPAMLPARLAAAVTERFVGRTVERERLTAAWKQATGESRSRVVLLSGEPGIGKTTLTARLADDVQVEGATVVYGRCDDDIGIPYQPWIEALTQLVADSPDEILAAHVADRGAHLARLVPTLARRTGVDAPGGDAGDSERYVLLGCLTDLLERASGEAPLLIVLDDLHWADRQTVQVLRHVATSALAAQVMVVGTFRDSDVADGDPMSDLLAALHRVDTAERIALRGLDDTDVLELLERIAGHEMDDTGVGLRDAVLAETDGNPFFVNEILRHLAETGAIYQNDDGRWVGDLDVRAVGLPVSVTEVIGRRVAALGTDTYQLLTLASVIGRDFDIATLATASGVDELAVIDHCDAAVAAAVLQTTSVVDRYTFTHALIERTLYDSMSPSRRARAHRTIAEAIEAAHGNDPTRAAVLAHHWTNAVQPTDTTKALHYAQIAGDRALAQLAPHDALHWYTQALELADRTDTPSRQRIELLIGLGTAQRQTGQAAHRETLLDAVRLANRESVGDLLVRAVLAGHRGFQSNVGEPDHERIEAIQLALDAVGQADSPERVRLLTMQAMEQALYESLEHRRRRVHESIAIARRLGVPELLAWALSAGANGMKTAQTLHEREAFLKEARTLLDEATPPETVFMVHAESRVVALDRGNLAAVLAHAKMEREACSRIPEPSRIWGLATAAATRALLRGHLDEAERLNQEALAIGLEAGQPDAFTVSAAQLANIRHHQGRVHELIPVMEDALAAMPALTAYRAAIAEALAYSEQFDAARSILEAALSDGLQTTPDQNWSFTTGLWADVAARLGHERAARLLHDRLSPHRATFVNIQDLVLKAAATLLGQLEHVLGRLDDADRSFAEGDELHRRLESPMLIAEGRAHWAAMLLDRNAPGDHDRARELAANALEVATAGGYGYTEALAREVLARLQP